VTKLWWLADASPCVATTQLDLRDHAVGDRHRALPSRTASAPPGIEIILQVDQDQGSHARSTAHRGLLTHSATTRGRRKASRGPAWIDQGAALPAHSAKKAQHLGAVVAFTCSRAAVSCECRSLRPVQDEQMRVAGHRRKTRQELVVLVLVAGVDPQVT